MRTSRRWFAVLLLALGLLPGVDRILLAHVHGGPELTLAAARPDAGSADANRDGWLDCAACHARAALDALVIDAHPERHGAGPFAAPLAEYAFLLPSRHAAAAAARAPPSRIV